MRDDEEKNQHLGFCVASRARVLFAKRVVIMPGFLGFILILCAGHGKLFIADVDGKSASNEIPRFLFCKTAPASGSFYDDITVVLVHMYTRSVEGSKDSAQRGDPLCRRDWLSPPLVTSCLVSTNNCLVSL